MLAVGRGAKLNRAGTKTMIVDATAEATLSNSEVLTNTRLSLGRHVKSIPTPHIPVPGPRAALNELLSLYAATERLFRIFSDSCIISSEGNWVSSPEVLLEIGIA